MKILRREESFGKKVINKEFSSKSRKYFDADVFDKPKNSKSSEDQNYDDRVLEKIENLSNGAIKVISGFVLPAEDDRTLDDNMFKEVEKRRVEKENASEEIEGYEPFEPFEQELFPEEQALSAEELVARKRTSGQVGEKTRQIDKASTSKRQIEKNAQGINGKTTSTTATGFIKANKTNKAATTVNNSSKGIPALPAVLIGIIIFLVLFVFVMIVVSITLMFKSPFWGEDTYSLVQVCKMLDAYYQNEIINEAAPLMVETDEGWSYPVILNDDINWRNTISVYYAYISDKELEDSTTKLDVNSDDYHYFESAFWACNDICVEYTSTFTLNESFDFIYFLSEDSADYSTITFDKGYLVLCYHPDPYVAAAALGFTETEYEALDDYLSSDYDESFEYLLTQIETGTGVGMIDVATPEVGNGWEKYCNWYTGSDYRFEWCAAFVSWCADQNGYIDSGIIPKDSWVKGYYEWFSDDDNPGSFLYVYDDAITPGSVIPQPGWLIIWEYDDDHTTLNHIGIVESYDPATNYITTIEGNASDQVSRYTNHRSWDSTVWGFCIPEYPEDVDYTTTNQAIIQEMLNVDSSYIPHSENFEIAAASLANSPVPSDMLEAGEEIIELLEEGVVIPDEVFDWYNSNDCAGMYDLYIEAYGTPTPTPIP